jgi:hypothetical protein
MSPTAVLKVRLTIALVFAGAGAGAAAGAVLTVLGKVVAGAPPATPANLAWNMAVFALAAAVVSPLVTWSAFRRVPLWRTVLEPLAGVIAGAGIAVALGSGVLLLLLLPAGLVAAMLRLGHRYADRSAAPLLGGGAHGGATG